MTKPAINCTPPDPTVFQVCEKMCPECLFTPAKIVGEERKQDILEGINNGGGSYFVCHKGSLTGNNQLCCRGWYDANPDAPIVVLAKSLKLVRFVPVPKVERNDDGTQTS